MALNIKVGMIGLFDMLKFKKMGSNRDNVIEAAKISDIDATWHINELGKKLHPDSQDMIVDEIVDHDNAGAKTFVLKRADGQNPAYFRAGQYLSLKLKIGDSILTRPISICSSPKQALEGKVAITVKTNPDGFAADWLLENLKVGDALEVSDPQGNFYYENLRDANDVIALAGGSGITPFISMARAIADGIEDFNLTILFGSRDSKCTLFKECLDKIVAAANGKVKVVHVLSDEKLDGYEHGFIDAELIKKYAPEGQYSIFMCGPEAMYRFAEKEIEKLNLPARLVRRELLGVAKDVTKVDGYKGDATATYKITVRKAGEEMRVIDAAANETVLVAIERAGIKAPSRCRSGECGWCRAQLVCGEVFIPQETDGRRWADVANNTIHPCAAFPLSDLTLEVAGEY